MKRTLLALSALSALAFAGAGFAQTAPAPAAKHAAQNHAAPNRANMGAPGGDRMRFDPAKFAERRTEHLRTLLQLRPEQDGALKAFVDATTPKGQMGERMRERQGQRGKDQNLTTPQRLEQARRMMTERQARFDQIATATLKFYNQLSPSQQKVFDTQQHRFGGRMHGRGGPGGRMGGQWGGDRGGRMGGHGGPMGGPQGGPMGPPPPR
jgi:protein CpxP